MHIREVEILSTHLANCNYLPKYSDICHVTYITSSWSTRSGGAATPPRVVSCSKHTKLETAKKKIKINNEKFNMI